MIRYCKVIGDSMFPTLKNGEGIIIDTSENALSCVEVGDIIVFKEPNSKLHRYDIKRVMEITGDGAYYVLGDNRKVSHDSRNFGLVPQKNLKGIMLKMVKSRKNVFEEIENIVFNRFFGGKEFA